MEFLCKYALASWLYICLFRSGPEGPELYICLFSMHSISTPEGLGIEVMNVGMSKLNATSGV